MGGPFQDSVVSSELLGPGIMPFIIEPMIALL